ncbi:MAG TPA: glycosyltransferase [Pirellulales bacterium]|jgi:glycosyltransferase involved in cell wall biosynthesis|nr:glycosyltransferase [Pirellulales bacterium]
MSILLEPFDAPPFRNAETDISRWRRPRQPLRVLHVVNGEHFAGAERVQDLLALRLPEFGIETSFVCVKPNRFPAARRSAAPLYKLPMRGRFDLRPAWKLARLIRDEQFALLHTHTPRAALIGRIAAKLARVPMVHHVHGQTASEIGRRWLSRLSAVVERFSLSEAKAVIAVSESAGRYIAAHGISAERVRVVSNGVPAREPLAPRSPPQDIWTLGVIALFRPRKGLEPLLEALAMLRQQGAAVRLRAVGSFETAAYERSVRSYTERLGINGAIDWTGFSSDVNGELAKLDLLVFPSLLAEGLPMVVIEAMAAGVPVIGTRVDGVVDAIRDGVDGLLCKPGDGASLAGAIGRVVRGEANWQSLRMSAWRRQREVFSDRSMARGMADLYREILC